MWLVPEEGPLENSAKYWWAQEREEVIQIGERTVREVGRTCLETFSGLYQASLALLKVCSIKEQQKATGGFLKKEVIKLGLLLRKIISAATLRKYWNDLRPVGSNPMAMKNYRSYGICRPLQVCQRGWEQVNQTERQVSLDCWKVTWLPGISIFSSYRMTSYLTLHSPPSLLMVQSTLCTRYSG